MALIALWTYNALGWALSESAWGLPSKQTLYQNYDRFGRVGQIQPPGSNLATELTYLGDRVVTKRQEVATRLPADCVPGFCDIRTEIQTTGTRELAPDSPVESEWLDMKLEGEQTLAAPREAVWAAVMDPAVIQAILPGCQDLQQVGENCFEGTLKIKVGPVQGEFKGKVELSDLQPPESYRLHLQGKSAAGFVDGSGTLQLQAPTEDTTTLRYDIDAQVGGRIASVGQRLLDSSARVVARQALEGLAQQITHRVESAASAQPTPPVTPPSSAKMAAEFTKELATELIPAARRPGLIILTAVVVLAVALLLLKTCAS